MRGPHELQRDRRAFLVELQTLSEKYQLTVVAGEQNAPHVVLAPLDTGWNNPDGGYALDGYVIRWDNR